METALHSTVENFLKEQNPDGQIFCRGAVHERRK
jgi:hypothetical protein